jgi:hypothetical protein
VESGHLRSLYKRHRHESAQDHNVKRPRHDSPEKFANTCSVSVFLQGGKNKPSFYKSARWGSGWGGGCGCGGFGCGDGGLEMQPAHL